MTLRLLPNICAKMGMRIVEPFKTFTMADNKQKTGKPDRDRISLSEDYEVQDWAKKFNVTPAELRKAVKEVGNNAKDVEQFFKKQ